MFKSYFNLIIFQLVHQKKDLLDYLYRQVLLEKTFFVIKSIKSSFSRCYYSEGHWTKYWFLQ
jgi:hypothetical protein